MKELFKSPIELRNEIIHRHHQGMSERRIASELGVSRWLVTKTVKQHRDTRRADNNSDDTNASASESASAVLESLGKPKLPRGSQLDAFEPQILGLLERYPKITIVRLHEELVSSGYKGGYSILADRVRQLRDSAGKPLTIRFETGPGAQAQMDWSTYEIDFTQEGRRKVQLFSYILGHSRRQYIHFTVRQDFETTIRQHIEAFKHLGGVAATCLYDNMKVVVTRWEDDQPIYNTRFLAFATHYGYRPWACQVRRPQTKGKVERHFYYIESNFLNARQFRSLEHLNKSAKWWLSEVADKRTHGTTKKSPLEMHAEELPHLLPLPKLQFDTAQVVYRIVDTGGTLQFASNHYSVPWQLVGELLPVRILADELVVYNGSLQEIARHVLVVGQTGQRRIAREHLPPRDHEETMNAMAARFMALGEVAVQFWEGLKSKTRYSKHHAQKVLSLLNIYHKRDVLLAMQRAVTYRAFGYDSLERILAHQSTPKPSWQQLSDSEQEAIAKLTDSSPIPPRHSQEYQDLLYGKSESSSESNTESPQHESKEESPEDRPLENRPPNDDPSEHGDTEDQDDRPGT